MRMYKTESSLLYTRNCKPYFNYKKKRLHNMDEPKNIMLRRRSPTWKTTYMKCPGQENL